MRMLSAAVVMVLLTAPAYAQTPNVNLIPELQSKSPEEKEQDAIKEKAYKDFSEKDSRRQGVRRSVGHRAQRRRAQGRSAGQAEDQDRKQQPVTAEAAGRIRSPPPLYSTCRLLVWSYDMVPRPRDLASRMAGRRKPDDGYLRETFTLPRDKARARARDFLNRYPKAAYMSAVESWRELPGGDIEFTMRRLGSAD